VHCLSANGMVEGKQSRMKDMTACVGKGWFTILSLYAAFELWFDKTWRPGEIEPVK
jgi:hypothetical protein